MVSRLRRHTIMSDELIVGIVILVGVIILLLICNHIRNNKVKIHLDSSYGTIEALGKRKNYIIQINQRYSFVVKDGQIISYKDSHKSDAMTMYAALEQTGFTGGNAKC